MTITVQAPLDDTASGKNRDTENFPVGSALIRPDLRAHVHAFYNFARAADDISDHPLMDPQEKIRRLDRFATVLGDNDLYDVPSAVAMRHSLKETKITPQHCLDLLTAFKRDATQLRYKDWADVMDYCRYSASPVGRHVLALHGVGEVAWPSNDALCSALQVINHVQDCADDYRELDRVYIPQDMLMANRGFTADLSRTKSTEALQTTLQQMLDKLEPMLKEARNLPRHVPDWRLKCETSIICVLAEKLVKLLRDRDPLCDNVKLGKPAIVMAGITGLVRAWL
ncbi:MAG TPA: squalene/phytoene synthase family protein [Alphaproteobacteria bacterium]|nr:squalene/phytoene synthase family protein [Alphaproteobacteria bacterium]